MKSLLLVVVICGLALNGVFGGDGVIKEDKRQICTYSHGQLVGKLGDGAGCGLINNYGRDKRYIGHVGKIEAGIVNNFAHGMPEFRKRDLESPENPTPLERNARAAIGHIGTFFSGSSSFVGGSGPDGAPAVGYIDHLARFNRKRETPVRNPMDDPAEERERRSAIGQVGNWNSRITNNYGREKRSAVGQVGNWYSDQTNNYGRE